MKPSERYLQDKEFALIVDRIVDEVHEPATYTWVNRLAEEQLRYQGYPEGIPDMDSEPGMYQVFVDSQVHFLRDVVMAVLDRM